MAHKSAEIINDNKINTKKCIKADKITQDTQVIRKKSKAGKKNRKNKANSVQCLSSASGAQVYSKSVPLPLLPTPYVSNMATYYPQIVTQSIPIEWAPIMPAVQIPTPMYTMPFQPLPVIVNPVVTTICPYTCTVLPPQVVTPVTQPIVTEIPTVTYSYEPTEVICTDQVSDAIYQVNEIIYEQPSVYIEECEETAIEDKSYAVQDDEITTNDQQCKSDSIEIYLSLPRNLFPAPRTLPIDANPIIDEFCKLKNVLTHVPWLLDLEFGIPKSPITRHIPVYNVNFNSIHCKNTPEAIHPGFDSCNEDFKREFLFYYDCIVSSLYTGYVMLHCDNSVDNFQSWLLFPMQELGMCWA